MHTVVSTVIVHAPVEVCYQVWSDFENLPRIMSKVKSVRSIGENRWRWEVEGPLDRTFGWDAQVVEMMPDKVISWSTSSDDEIATSGSVNFLAEQPDRTLLEVKMAYSPPNAPLGELLADTLRQAERIIDQSLMEFKTYVERQYQGTVSDTETVWHGGKMGKVPGTPMHSDEEVRHRLQGVQDADVMKRRRF